MYSTSPGSRCPISAMLLRTASSLGTLPRCAHLLTCAQDQDLMCGPGIVAGSVMNPLTRTHDYGGYNVLRRGFRTELVPVLPDSTKAVHCDTMNGNFVYIPHAITAVLGNLEGSFTHQFCDLDYGLRAAQAGFQVTIAPGYCGTCKPNSAKNTWRDETIPFRERWLNLVSPKGAPPLEWLTFVRRHYRWRWLFYLLSPYVKTILKYGITTKPHQKRPA